MKLITKNLLPNTSNNWNLIGEIVEASSYNLQETFNTLEISTNKFTGKIILEGNLNDDINSDDWYIIFEKEFINESSIQSFNLNICTNFLRVKLDRNYLIKPELQSDYINFGNINYIKISY